jgi:hypothetical protein
MVELVARDIPNDVVDEIRRRALKRGVSAEVEAGLVLTEALTREKASARLGPGDEGYTLLHHLWRLGEIAPDFEFVDQRK